MTYTDSGGAVSCTGGAVAGSGSADDKWQYTCSGIPSGTSVTFSFSGGHLTKNNQPTKTCPSSGSTSITTTINSGNGVTLTTSCS